MSKQSLNPLREQTAIVEIRRASEQNPKEQVRLDSLLSLIQVDTVVFSDALEADNAGTSKSIAASSTPNQFTKTTAAAATVPVMATTNATVDFKQPAVDNGSNQPLPAAKGTFNNAYLQHVYSELNDCIQAYYADWSGHGPSSGMELVHNAQRSADSALSMASERLAEADDGVCLMVVGAMRSGKSTLLSSLVGGPGAEIFPAFAANESFSMVPVKMGAAADTQQQRFTVRVQFASLIEWHKRQREAAELLFEQWKVGADLLQSERQRASGDERKVLDVVESDDVKMDADNDDDDDDDASSVVRQLQARILDMSAASMGLPTAANETEAATEQQPYTMTHWIRSSRTGGAEVENHILKSLYAELDLSDEALLHRYNGVLPSADECAQLEHRATTLMHKLRDGEFSEPASRAIDALLSTGQHSPSRIIEFCVRDVEEVSLLLFSLAVDHATRALRDKLHSYRQRMTQLLGEQLNGDHALLSLLAPILTCDSAAVVSDLWPIVQQVEVEWPRSQWTLAPRVRVIDSAGLSCVQQLGDNNEFAAIKKQVEQLRVNRLWYVSVSSAAGAGRMENGVLELLRATQLPVDVVVTKSGSAGLTDEQLRTKEQEIDQILARNYRHVEGRLKGKTFHVECHPQPRTGHIGRVQALSDHLVIVQNAQYTAALNALARAVVLRLNLIRLAGKHSKVETREGEQLTQNVREQMASDKIVLVGSDQWQQPSDVQYTLLMESITALSDPGRDELRLLLETGFSTDLYKQVHWQRLLAWVRSEKGVAVGLSLAQVIQKRFFDDGNRFLAPLNTFVEQQHQQLDRDIDMVAGRVIQLITVRLTKAIGEAARTAIVSLAALLQDAKTDAVTQAKAKLQETVDAKVRNVTEMEARIAAALPLLLAEGGVLSFWVFTGNTRRRETTLNHIRAFMIGDEHRAAVMVRLCGKAVSSSSKHPHESRLGYSLLAIADHLSAEKCVDCCLSVVHRTRS